MTVIKVRAIISGLQKKGFRVFKGRHKHLVLYVNDKKTSIWTVVSHGSGEIGDSLIEAMSQQLRLEKDRFVDLVECPLTFEEYVRELEAQGILSPSTV